MFEKRPKNNVSKIDSYVSVKNPTPKKANNNYMSSILDYISFNRIQNYVENLMKRESAAGIFEHPVEIIIDTALTDYNGQLSVTMWDYQTGKPYAVNYTDVADRCKMLVEKGMTRAAVLLSSSSPFGECVVTKYLSVHTRKVNEGDEEDAEASADDDASTLSAEFRAGTNVDVNIEGTEHGYVVCRKRHGETGYLVSVMPSESRDKLEQFFFDDLFANNKMSAVRTMDRVIPVSNYILNNLPENTSETNIFMCIEQCGDNLMIWNLVRLPSGIFVPVGQNTKKIPALETSDVLINDISFMEHHLIRIKNFNPPEKVVIVSNDEPMLDGVFKMNDLADICRTVVGLEPDNTSDVYIMRNKSAAISGLLQMEHTFVENRTMIKEIRKGD